MRLTVKRENVRQLLDSQTLRHGNMLQVVWPRLTDKTAKIGGKKVIVEPAGSLVRRRVVLRNDWSKPTKSFTPAGGIMFNVESQEKAMQIRAKNDLYLAYSIEGVTHPFGEKDHPVNIPLSTVLEIYDTHNQVMYRVED